jgi:cytidylate kinase
MTGGGEAAAGRKPVKVVTVSATYGAGGTAVARLLAKQLGLPFADRLLTSTGQPDPAIAERVTEQELDEEPRSPLLEGLALLSTAWNIPVPRDPEDMPERLRTLIERSIQTLIDAGGAVILGRAAAAALGRRPGAFHVRLDGPADRRARRGAVWEGVDIATAKAHLVETDAARSRSLRRLYGQDSSNPALYHLVIDATTITVDALVDLIAAAAEDFWLYDDSQLERLVAKTRARLTEPPP